MLRAWYSHKSNYSPWDCIIIRMTHIYICFPYVANISLRVILFFLPSSSLFRQLARRPKLLHKEMIHRSKSRSDLTYMWGSTSKTQGRHYLPPNTWLTYSYSYNVYAYGEKNDALRRTGMMHVITAGDLTATARTNHCNEMFIFGFFMKLSTSNPFIFSAAYFCYVVIIKWSEK